MLLLLADKKVMKIDMKSKGKTVKENALW